MSELNINKYLYENYDDSEQPYSYFIQKNMKNDKSFNKFIKICMKYKIYLFHKINDDNEYKIRKNKELIWLINKKKSTIIAEFGKIILRLHNFDKFLETSTSENFSDVYDTKNKIDQLYIDFNKNYRYLDLLIKLLNDQFTDDILLKYITKEVTILHINNVIDEFSN
jgi:hypothetical protein